VNEPLRLGIVGFGKIARDQHLPAILASSAFELVAVADPHVVAPGVRNYAGVAEMLAGEPGLEAVILCQPPQLRFAAARLALQAGRHVFLEKPPGTTLSEAEALAKMARDAGLTLFTAWHSQEASGVAQARQWLEDKALHSVRIDWKEDVRVWHPGQQWIWQPGGFGVFDPGINALSILTEIVPEPIRLVAAELEVPENRQVPIAAQLSMESLSGVPIAAEFDFRQTGPQSWNILVDTACGELLLSEGGNALAIDGVPRAVTAEREYPALYDRFRNLIASGQSNVNLAPLRIVADAFLLGQSRTTAPFIN
jgi:D-galactose 1-dehydrogenase